MMALDTQQLTAAIEQLLSKEKVAGISVAVTDRKQLRYHKAFGVESVDRPGVANDPDALYRVASITKITVSILIQQLLEQGLLSLDALVKGYLPNLVLSRPEAETQLTIEHLLTHTGGFPTEEWMEEGPRDESAFEESVLNSVKELKMHALPSQRVYCYSNAGYNLLALIAAKVTGQPFSKLMQERVLNPLGMKRSTFDFLVAASYPLSQPHDLDENGALRALHTHRMNTIYYGAGGLFSNASDLCALARFFMNDGVTDRGERLLPKARIGEILKKRVRRNEYEQYGYGMFIREKDGRCLFGHTGNYDPYNSSVFFDLKSGFGVAVLINTIGSESLRYTITERIFALLDE